MTTQTGETQPAIEVSYEGPAPSFGGFDSADFALDRPNQHILEVNLRLSSDARAIFEQALAEGRADGLDETSVQRLLAAIGMRLYGAIPAGDLIPAIITLRARDIDADTISDLLTEAGLL
jgi:hypothetical protein